MAALHLTVDGRLSDLRRPEEPEQRPLVRTGLRAEPQPWGGQQPALALLQTPRLQQAIAELVQNRQEPGWCDQRPVLLLDRCWLRLEAVAITNLPQRLPVDASAEAPELRRYRELCNGALTPEASQARCWQEFGRAACSAALQRFWQAQQRRNHGWTLEAYLVLWSRYRQLVETTGSNPVPLLVLARPGSQEEHHLIWCWQPATAMRHTAQ